MSRKGGYQIVNLKDTALTVGTGETIEGVYETFEGNYRKPVLLSGINVGGVEYADTFINPTISGGNYTATVYGMTFTVTPENLVTFTS